MMAGCRHQSNEINDGGDHHRSSAASAALA